MPGLWSFPCKLIAASVGNCRALQNGSHILLSPELSRCHSSWCVAAKQEWPNGDEERVECAIHFAKPSNFQPTLRSPCSHVTRCYQNSGWQRLECHILKRKIQIDSLLAKGAWYTWSFVAIGERIWLPGRDFKVWHRKLTIWVSKRLYCAWFPIKEKHIMGKLINAKLIQTIIIGK